MSLLFPDTLSIYITTDRVQGVKLVGWGAHPVELRQREVQVQGTDHWQSIEQVVADLVKQTKVQRLRVVLADKLVRYACFPWRSDLRDTEEELALARLNFDAVHGPQASDAWHFGFSNGRLGRTRLSIAFPETLHAMLRNNFGQEQAKVVSVQTAFTAVARAHRAKFGNRGWLVNMEEDRFTVGSWSQDTWNWIFSSYDVLKTPAELVERVRQEVLLSSTSLNANLNLPVFLHSPLLEHLPMENLPGVQFNVLKTSNVKVGPKYAFPLLGGAN